MTSNETSGSPGLSDIEVQALQAGIARLTMRVEDLEAAAVPGYPSGGEGGGAAPVLVYASLEGWVAGRFAPMVERPVGGSLRWCRRWWAHPEAISRLEALWRSWEHLRLDPALGMAAWYRDHLDHHLPVLLGAHGPFAGCSPDQHHQPAELPLDPAPDGWWDPAGTDTPDQPADSIEGVRV